MVAEEEQSCQNSRAHHGRISGLATWGDPISCTAPRVATLCTFGLGEIEMKYLNMSDQTRAQHELATRLG